MTPMRTFRLGDVGKIITGKTPPAAKPEHFGAEIPFLTPTDIDGVARHVTTARFLSKAGAQAFQRLLLPPQSVCCVCIGATIGKVCLTQGVAASNQQINSIVVDQRRHDPRYIFYKLLTLGGVLKAQAGGAATPIVNKSQFSDLEVELPDLDLQSRTAEVLSAYDDLIENNMRRIAILEEMARRIFEEWFVRFRAPGCESLPLIDSPLGPIPQGWEVASLPEVADITYGFAFKSKLFNSENLGAGVIRIRDIPEGRTKTFTTEIASDKYQVRDGDVLIGMDGIFHMCLWSGGDAFLNQRVARLRPLQQHSLYWLFLNVRAPIKKLEKTIVGTTVAHLSARDMNQMLVVRPPLSMQERLTGMLDPLAQLEIVLKKQNTNLRAQRDLLLPKLISGEIDVSAMPSPSPLKEAAE